jgi:hypothetical protein
MPPLAREKSRAGAKAFVRHYIDVINYSWTSLRTARLASLGAADCADCDAIVTRIDEVEKAGGYKRGAKWHATAMTVIATQGIQDPIVQVLVKIDQGKFLDHKGGTVQAIDATQTYMDFELTRRARMWAVTNVEVQS